MFVVLATAPLASGTSAAAATTEVPKRSFAMQGEWVLLGPASLAHIPAMIEFIDQSQEPTASYMTNVGLTDKVLSEDALQVKLRTTDINGLMEDVTITLPDSGLLMIASKGDEPLVFRK